MYERRKREDGKPISIRGAAERMEEEGKKLGLPEHSFGACRRLIGDIRKAKGTGPKPM
jgi:hypothetical protein